MSLPVLSEGFSEPPLAIGARGKIGSGADLALACVLMPLLVMPVVYDLVAFRGGVAEALKAPVLEHIALNCVANAVVMLSAIRFQGRLDEKLGSVFNSVLLAHGSVAFVTLIFRHYYSIPMLLTGAAASAVLGGSAMFVRHRAVRLPAAVLGPWHPLLADNGLVCERIEDPAADIRCYDPLIVTFAGGLSAEWASAVSRALLCGKRVRHAAEYLEEMRGVVSIEHFNIDHLPPGGLTSYRARKRLMELAVVVITLPMTLPLLLAGSLAVLFAMGRPVFFRQSRVGVGGEVFSMVKLRTMRPPLPAELGVATLRNDRRITPLGRWLRRFHIDELPQIWNVLKGEMSIVGPRPEQPQLAETYRTELPAFAYRQMVRPGITGWAQVRAGYAADLAETQVKLGYDLFYLQNFSFELDLQILARTLWTLARGGGVR
ncbi:MAG: sugar transferase [Caulobacteraceae bacterium]